MEVPTASTFELVLQIFENRNFTSSLWLSVLASLHIYILICLLIYSFKSFKNYPIIIFQIKISHKLPHFSGLFHILQAHVSEHVRFLTINLKLMDVVHVSE